MLKNLSAMCVGQTFHIFHYEAIEMASLVLRAARETDSEKYLTGS
jgi:hypothetical protein